MTDVPDEARLIAARGLRQQAWAIVRTDLATLRFSLADRPLTQRVRDRAVVLAVDTAEDGLELARENRGVLALTLTSLIGWVFRKRLVAVAQQGWTWAEHRWRRWRH